MQNKQLGYIKLHPKCNKSEFFAPEIALPPLQAHFQWGRDPLITFGTSISEPLPPRSKLACPLCKSWIHQWYYWINSTLYTTTNTTILIYGHFRTNCVSWCL